MKNKIIIILALLLSCLTSYAGRNSATFGGAAFGAAAGAGLGSAFGGSRGVLPGAIIGGLFGAAIGNDISNSRCNTYTERTYYAPRNNYYTERVEVYRPVETRRVYRRPRERVVSYNYYRPAQCYTDVYQYDPGYTEYRTVCY